MKIIYCRNFIKKNIVKKTLEKAQIFWKVFGYKKIVNVVIFRAVLFTRTCKRTASWLSTSRKVMWCSLMVHVTSWSHSNAPLVNGRIHKLIRQRFAIWCLLFLKIWVFDLFCVLYTYFGFFLSAILQETLSISLVQ